SVRVNTQGQNGIVLVEAYDLEAVDSGTARLVNVSARNQIGTGGNVLVAGFVIGGSGGKTVLIRGVGATLGDFGVNGVLANPVLEVHRQITGGSELVAQNDDWNGNAEIATVAQSVGAFALSSDVDAALLISLQPGAYTATVRGANDTTGIGIVEV